MSPPLQRGERIPSVAEILMTVSCVTGVTLHDLLGPRRMRALARPRQVAMWAATLCPNKSLPQIGAAIGGRSANQSRAAGASSTICRTATTGGTQC